MRNHWLLWNVLNFRTVKYYVWVLQTKSNAGQVVPDPNPTILLKFNPKHDTSIRNRPAPEAKKNYLYFNSIIKEYCTIITLISFYCIKMLPIQPLLLKYIVFFNKKIVRAFFWKNNHTNAARKNKNRSQWTKVIEILVQSEPRIASGLGRTWLPDAMQDFN